MRKGNNGSYLASLKTSLCNLSIFTAEMWIRFVMFMLKDHITFVNIYISVIYTKLKAFKDEW